MRALLVLLVIVACSDNAPPPAPKPGATWPHEYPHWSFDLRLRTWQGAWVLPGYERFGTTFAVEIRGFDVRIADGASERPGTLELLSPCYARLTDSRDGAQFLFGYSLSPHGELIATKAGYAIGARHGDDAIACFGTEMVTRLRGSCTRWDPVRDVRRRIECSWTASGLHTELGDVPTDGEVLIERDRAVPRATKHANLDAARRALKR